MDRGSTSKRRCATYNTKGLLARSVTGAQKKGRRKKTVWQRRKIYKYSAVDLRLNVGIRRVVVVEVEGTKLTTS